MKKSQKTLLGIQEHEPNWLKWTTIKRKYPDKWVLLGYQTKGSLENVELDVLVVADTFEEVVKYDSIYTDDYVDTGFYMIFSIRKTTSPHKKRRKIIISHSKTKKT